MKDLDIADYLVKVCNELKTQLPEDIYSCDIYAGELESDATKYLNFNVNKKAQCFVSFDNFSPQQGVNLIGDATFAIFVAAITDPKTIGFSLSGMKISQKVAGFINESDSFNEGTAGRPKLVDYGQIVVSRDESKNKLYNIFRIVYSQKIILKQK